ncbi:MAG: hypothetical protein LKG27_03100 [Clostridiaceae bacterium]|nr:hypothetical protein [Clostridiaceae bacterium]
MITVNPIKLTTVKPISFGEKNNDISRNVAIMSLQNPNAKVKFEKDFNATSNSDAVQANPLTALGYKFVKTYNILFNSKKNVKDTPNNVFTYYG